MLELLRGCVTSASGSTFHLQQGLRQLVAFRLLTGTGSFSRKNGSRPAAGMEVVFCICGRQRCDGDSFSQSRGDRAFPASSCVNAGMRSSGLAQALRTEQSKEVSSGASPNPGERRCVCRRPALFGLCEPDKARRVQSLGKVQQPRGWLWSRWVRADQSVLS